MDPNRTKGKLLDAALVASMMPEKIRSFPLPFEDETVFSLVSRYHVLAGRGSSKETLRQLFGASTVVLRNLPGRLERFAQAFPEGYPLDASGLIEKHTTLPYYRLFLAEERYARIEHAMRFTDARGVKGILGVLASRLGSKDPLRFCPDCIREDLRQRGQPYWRRTHLLFGTLVCPRHASILFEWRDDPYRPNRHGLFLPPVNADPEHCVPCLSEAQHVLKAPLSRIAEANAGIFALKPAVISSQRLKQLYLTKLISLGLTGRRGQVDIEKAAKLVWDRLSVLSELNDFAFLRKNRVENWLRAILRKDRETNQPLTHVVMIDVLFGDLNAVLRQSDLATQGAHIPVSQIEKTPSLPALPRVLSDAAKNAEGVASWYASLHRLLVEEGMSLRAAARSVGKTATSVRIQAERLGIPVKRRPKLLNPELEASILTELRYGSPRSKVAARFGVSPASISRLLTAHPEIRDSLRESSTRSKLGVSRAKLILVSRRNPRWGRKQIHQAIPAAYIWLYRHDREWLEAELGSRKKYPASTGRRRVDWEERDRLLAEKLYKVAQQFLDRSGKPVRVTRSALGRAAGCAATIDKHLERLPQSRKLLLELCESTERFKLRRVHWVAQTLTGQGKQILAWRIRRLAGLGPKESSDVELVIQKIVGQADTKDEQTGGQN